MSTFKSANAGDRSIGTGAAGKTAFANRKISVGEAATYLGISKSFLDKKRLDGSGPIYMKIGRRVTYDLSDLEIWVAGQKRRHTSEVAQLSGARQP